MGIRPSQLQIAEKCDLASWLAREYPGTSEAAERGNEVDRRVCEALNAGITEDDERDPDARACIDWVWETFPRFLLIVQESVELRDEEGAFITKGTPDIVAIRKGTVSVVDLKKREQWYAARLAPPDDNLQLHAYGLAHALRSGAPEYRLCVLLFGDGEVEPLWSRTYTSAEWRPILERIKRICSRVMKPSDTRPKGFSGPHCTGCYQRRHCPHWMLPAMSGENALVGITGPGGITKDNAARALLLSMQLGEARDVLADMLKAYVDAHGPIQIGEDKQWGPVIQRGRKTADVQALERDGLRGYIRHGKASVSYRIHRTGGKTSE